MGHGEEYTLAETKRHSTIQGKTGKVRSEDNQVFKAEMDMWPV